MWCVVSSIALAACPHKSDTLTPEPTAPLPTAGIASQQVAVLPLTLVAAEDSLHWEAVLGERRVVLAKSDSIIGTLLEQRADDAVALREHDPALAQDRLPVERVLRRDERERQHHRHAAPGAGAR